MRAAAIQPRDSYSWILPHGVSDLDFQVVRRPKHWRERADARHTSRVCDLETNQGFLPAACRYEVRRIVERRCTQVKGKRRKNAEKACATVVALVRRTGQEPTRLRASAANESSPA